MNKLEWLGKVGKWMHWVPSNISSSNRRLIPLSKNIMWTLISLGNQPPPIQHIFKFQNISVATTLPSYCPGQPNQLLFLARPRTITSGALNGSALGDGECESARLWLQWGWAFAGGTHSLERLLEWLSGDDSDKLSLLGWHKMTYTSTCMLQTKIWRHIHTPKCTIPHPITYKHTHRLTCYIQRHTHIHTHQNAQYQHTL